MKATIRDFIISKTQIITLETSEDFREQFDKLKDKVLSVEIKQWREKRSKDANAYSWVLTDKMADVLKVSKEQVHFDMLKEYGQKDIVPVWKKAEETLLKYIAYYEKLGETELNGQEFVHYKVFKPSHEFDTAEMAIFIDGIISECKELGIETAMPEQLSILKEEWGK